MGRVCTAPSLHLAREDTLQRGTSLSAYRCHSQACRCYHSHGRTADCVGPPLHTSSLRGGGCACLPLRLPFLLRLPQGGGPHHTPQGVGWGNNCKHDLVGVPNVLGNELLQLDCSGLATACQACRGVPLLGPRLDPPCLAGWPFISLAAEEPQYGGTADCGSGPPGQSLPTSRCRTPTHGASLHFAPFPPSVSVIHSTAAEQILSPTCSCPKSKRVERRAEGLIISGPIHCGRR